MDQLCLEFLQEKMQVAQLKMCKDYLFVVNSPLNLFCPLRDIDQVVTKLCLDRTVNRSHLFIEYDLEVQR